MKEDLLVVLAQLEPESLDTVEVMMEAMSSVTNDVEELSSTSQVNAKRPVVIPHSTSISGKYLA